MIDSMIENFFVKPETHKSKCLDMTHSKLILQANNVVIVLLLPAITTLIRKCNKFIQSSNTTHRSLRPPIVQPWLGRYRRAFPQHRAMLHRNVLREIRGYYSPSFLGSSHGGVDDSSQGVLKLLQPLSSHVGLLLACNGEHALYTKHIMYMDTTDMTLQQALKYVK